MKQKKIAKAIAITAKALEKKFDRGGQPLILHCIRVMEDTIGDECVKCAAVMHDLIEETEYTLPDLVKLNFSTKTISLLLLLTKNENESYENYIQQIAGDLDAINIKKSDLKDNLNSLRLKKINAKDLERMEMYHNSYLFLTEKQEQWKTK